MVFPEPSHPQRAVSPSASGAVPSGLSQPHPAVQVSVHSYLHCLFDIDRLYFLKIINLYNVKLRKTSPKYFLTCELWEMVIMKIERNIRGNGEYDMFNS